MCIKADPATLTTQGRAAGAVPADSPDSAE